MNKVETILAERGARYGKFEDHARVAITMKRTLGHRLLERQRAGELGEIRFDVLEALDMIAHKLARIANGDPEYADSWRDIAGYATLVADRIEGESR